MNTYPDLPRTALEYAVRFYSGLVGFGIATALLAAPAAVVILIYVPDAVPYLVLGGSVLSINGAASLIELVRDDEDIELSVDTWGEVSVYFLSNALYMSTLIGGSAVLAVYFAPFESMTYLSAATAVLLPIADFEVLQRFGLSPATLPVVPVLGVFFIIGTINSPRIPGTPVLDIFRGGRRDVQ